MSDDPKALEAKYKPKEFTTVVSDRQVHSARFSPCGRFLVGGDYEGRIRRWKADADSYDALMSIEPQGAWVQAIALQKSGDVLFEGDTWGRLSAWKTSGEKPERLWQVDAAHDGWLRDLSLSPDGSLLASAGNDRAVRIWNAADGKPVKELKGDSAEVFCVVWSAEGTSVYSADFKGTARKWDVAASAVSKSYDAGLLAKSDRLQDIGGIRLMRILNDGKTVLLGGTVPANGGNVQGVPTLLAFDSETAQQPKKYDLGAVGDVYVSDVAVHPDGFWIVTTCGNPGQGKLLFLKPEDEKPFFTLAMSNCHSVSLHPNGKRFAVATTNPGSNGNGKSLDKEGKYPANSSPIKVFEFPAST